MNKTKTDYMFQVVILIFTLALSGCVSWSKHGVFPQANGKYRIAVVPFQSDLKIKKLKYIQNIPKDFVHPANEESLVETKFGEIRKEMTLSLEDKLNNTGKFEVAQDSEVEKAISDLNLSSSTLKM